MPKSKVESTYFVVTYRDPQEDKIKSIKSRSINDSGLGLSFISISDFIFDTESVVVNPAEEEQAKHFEHVKNLHLSIYHIISIEEVGEGHQGLKFKHSKNNLVVLPGKES